MYQHVVNFIVDIVPCILMLIPILTFIDFLSTSLLRKMQFYHVKAKYSFSKPFLCIYNVIISPCLYVHYYFPKTETITFDIISAHVTTNEYFERRTFSTRTNLILISLLIIVHDFSSERIKPIEQYRRFNCLEP